MSSSKIKLGILGGGGNSLIGVLHRIASSMFDRYQIVGGVFNPNWDENIEFATKIGLPTDRVYIDFETPLYKLRIGNYTVRKNAEKAIKSISRLGVKDSWIIRTKTTIED